MLPRSFHPVNIYRVCQASRLGDSGAVEVSVLREISPSMNSRDDTTHTTQPEPTLASPANHRGGLAAQGLLLG